MTDRAGARDVPGTRSRRGGRLERHGGEGTDRHERQYGAGGDEPSPAGASTNHGVI